jgi:hypothetical protein
MSKAQKLGGKITSDRGHIDASVPDQMHWWARHLGVSVADLLRAVDKVGNSVTAIRKELGK